MDVQFTRARANYLLLGTCFSFQGMAGVICDPLTPVCVWMVGIRAHFLYKTIPQKCARLLIVHCLPLSCRYLIVTCRRMPTSGNIQKHPPRFTSPSTTSTFSVIAISIIRRFIVSYLSGYSLILA